MTKRTQIHAQVEDCQDGRHPRMVCRLESGWVVMGPVQFVRGYCLLLPDPVVPDLNSLSKPGRERFLYEMSLVGDAVLAATGAPRLNYEMLGNVEQALHAHVFPRYDDEPEILRQRPVWFYDWETATPFDPERDASLVAGIRERLVQSR